MREHLEREVDEPTTLGTGAVVIVDDACWAYYPEPVRGLLGATLVWAHSRGATQSNLILDEPDGVLAFVATGFGEPRPRVWHAVERSIHRVDAQPPAIPPAPDCPESTALLASRGLEVVADHGVWLGEFNGLEVARVGVRDGECGLDIGVGAYDQFASAALHLDRDDDAAIDHVLGMVRPHRVAGADPHPIGRLVRSRWLRAQLIVEPALIDLRSLNPVPLLLPRPGLVESQPAVGMGQSVDGDNVLVVCSTGIDLGVAETAAGLAALMQPQRIVVVMPQRDHHPRIGAALETLAHPAELVAVEGLWSD